jgi:phage terminase small subunit
MTTAELAKGLAKKVPGRKASRKPAAAKTQPIIPKVERFIEQYLIDLNASQAYVRSHPGMKITTARIGVARLLANPLVQERIAARAQEVERSPRNDARDATG